MLDLAIPCSVCLGVTSNMGDSGEEWGEELLVQRICVGVVIVPCKGNRGREASDQQI